MRERLQKIYLELTNVCNLSCAFCHGTRRTPGFLAEEDFRKILGKIKGKSTHLYFHLMGEPLLHPQIDLFSALAHEAGFRVMLTTNGTLLREKGGFITATDHVYKVSVSLHSQEDTPPGEDLDVYYRDCFAFGRECASRKNGPIMVYRLWDSSFGKENDGLRRLREAFPDEWIKNRSGYKLIDAPKGQKEVYLEFGERFTWPDKDSPPQNDDLFCYALRDHVGILCDGTVVPCCLDADGALPLGNLLDSDITLDAILDSSAARSLYDSFTAHIPPCPLCASCGYAARFR